MIEIKNLRLIGSSHISPDSIKEAVDVIKEYQPEVVALELDSNRFVALMRKEREKNPWRIIKEIGVMGYFFNLIGSWLEKKMGEIVGVKPGSEMIAATKVARECNAKIALIDRDIRITIKRLFKLLTWKEKFRFVWDIISSPFSKRYAFDLTKVPDEKFIKDVIKIIKKRYPNFYKALVDERDEYMAVNLKHLMEKNTKIVAVVGAGHLDGITRRLQ